MTPAKTGPRRLLREPDAAAYCAVSATKFGQLVQDGRMPQGHRIDGCKVWDLRELDAAIDALLYGAPEVELEWER